MPSGFPPRPRFAKQIPVVPFPPPSVMLSIDLRDEGGVLTHPALTVNLIRILPLSFLAISVLFCALRFLYGTWYQDRDNLPVHLPKSGLFTPQPFFRRRFEFLNAGFQGTGQSLFKFNLLKHTVVAVSGEVAREAFLKAKYFDITEGFLMLSGSIPTVNGVPSKSDVALIHKRLQFLQREASLKRLIPEILDDMRQAMENWSSSGFMDPFVALYNLLFQTSVRLLTCHEIADNPVLTARLREQYEILETAVTPMTVLLPLLPSLASLKRWMATYRIYRIISSAVNARLRSGVPQDDTLQMLLDLEDDPLLITGFCMGLMVAGARSTGTTSTWLLIFLASNPEWSAKARAEVESILTEHPLPPDSPYSLSAHLARVPLEVLESETPVLDSLIRETLRLAQPHTAMRRNKGPDVRIGDGVVPSGSYVLYPFSDTHLNAKYYPDPWRFDPARIHDKKTWMGWGRGSVTCLGTRLAKIELKLITAMMLIGFHFRVVDASGQETEVRPDWNDYMTCRPSTGPISFEYTRTGVLL